MNVYEKKVAEYYFSVVKKWNSVYKVVPSSEGR